MRLPASAVYDTRSHLRRDYTGLDGTSHHRLINPVCLQRLQRYRIVVLTMLLTQRNKHTNKILVTTYCGGPRYKIFIQNQFFVCGHAEKSTDTLKNASCPRRSWQMRNNLSGTDLLPCGCATDVG